MSLEDGLCDLDQCDRKLAEAAEPGNITSISSVSNKAVTGPTDFYFCSEEHARAFVGPDRAFGWKPVPPRFFQR